MQPMQPTLLVHIVPLTLSVGKTRVCRCFQVQRGSEQSLTQPQTDPPKLSFLSSSVLSGDLRDCVRRLCRHSMFATRTLRIYASGSWNIFREFHVTALQENNCSLFSARDEPVTASLKSPRACAQAGDGAGLTGFRSRALTRGGGGVVFG